MTWKTRAAIGIAIAFLAGGVVMRAIAGGEIEPQDRRTPDDRRDRGVTVQVPTTRVDVDDSRTRVRAPFTSVDVDGPRTRVRAPFTSVDVDRGRVRIDVPFFSGEFRR